MIKLHCYATRLPDTRSTSFLASLGSKIGALHLIAILSVSPALAQDAEVESFQDQQLIGGEPALSESYVGSESQETERTSVNDAGTGVVEEVFITGSLLPKGNYASSAPIATITNQQFEITNTVNVEQLLNTMPQVLAGSDRSSTFGFGWATADLRGLGQNRTSPFLMVSVLPPPSQTGGQWT